MDRRQLAKFSYLDFIAQKEEAGIQLTFEEFDFMVAAGACEETERVNANCTLENNLQQASTSGTYLEQSRGTVDQNPATAEEIHAHFESLYNNLATEVEKVKQHDPPDVYDSEETLQLAQEIRLKMKQLNKEIKPANYTKINHLSDVFVSQTDKSREELYFSNTSKTTNVSKSILIPNEEFSDDTTPKATKFDQDFKSLAKEADESLTKNKALELEIERLLRAVVSQDIMSIVQTYNDMKQKIERLQAQLGDQKGKSKDTPCVSNTLDPLSQKLEDENVSKQKDTTHGTRVNTKFVNQSILGKSPSSRPKLYYVTPLPKSKVFPKVGESNALSKLVTSNSTPSSHKSTVVNNERVIAS
ncbi:hypothetical protein Tco_0519587 [Tanacetum coccineum]